MFYRSQFLYDEQNSIRSSKSSSNYNFVQIMRNCMLFYLQLFVGELMSYLFLCMFAYSDVQHFAAAQLFSFLCCALLFCLSSFCVFVYPMLPVSLDCPFLIAPTFFSNVYLLIELFMKSKPFAHLKGI